MSKMDGLRAMREARYEAARAGAGKTAAAARSTAQASPAKAKRPPVAPEATGEELCGHKAISGRTCTREKGHAAKSHRYA